MAKQYLVHPRIEPLKREVVTLEVPAANTIHAGEIFKADSLVNDKELILYKPEKVADIAKDELVIVKAGMFETLEDGRRPDGNPNYLTYVAKEGEVVSAIRLNVPNQKLQISADCIKESDKAAVAVGDMLIPEVGQTALKRLAKGQQVTAKNYLVVEAKTTVRVGTKLVPTFDCISKVL